MDKKFKRKEDSFEFTPKRVKQESGELEVTGVSRSGRVRKKSSKLMDFENLDEIDIRANAKKKEKADPFLASGEPDFGRLPKKEVRPVVKEEVFTDEDLGDTSMPYTKQERLSDESDHEIVYPPQHEESSMESIASEIEDGDENDLSRIQSEGFQSIAGDHDFPTSQQRSVFPVEKVPPSKKKLVIKDGKIVGRVKTPKKEKTPGRLSAYMLWAKEIRQELVRSNPNLDFSQTSKKLGELWSTVPMHEKHIWKKRAKRAAEGAAAANTPVKTAPNVKGFGQQQQQLIRPQHEGKKMKSPQPRKLASKSSPNDLGSSPLGNSMLSINSSPEMKVVSKSHADQSVYKPVGTTPLDIAAHIRLLGESLTIIGERLTEHEGQIAVSGSFSVLLDSLLCVLAPLMCLTQQVPQMNVIPQEQLSGLMDNIAYIMPGL